MAAGRDRQVAARLGFSEAGDRAGPWLLLRRRDDARGVLRYHAGSGGMQNPLAGVAARRRPDQHDVDLALGSEEGEGDVVYRRQRNERYGGAFLGLGESGGAGGGVGEGDDPDGAGDCAHAIRSAADQETRDQPRDGEEGARAGSERRYRMAREPGHQGRRDVMRRAVTRGVAASTLAYMPF